MAWYANTHKLTTKSRLRMYKDRISKWKLDNKKLKPAEVAQILYLQRRRQELGKSSVFYIQGRKVSLKNLTAYVRRKQKANIAIEEHTELDSSLGIVCRTPSPEPMPMVMVPYPLVAPNSLQLPDEVFRTVRIYCDGAFDAGIWVHSANGRCYGKGGRQAAQDLRKWTKRFTHAGALYQHGEVATAFRIVNSLFDSFADMIRQQDFILLNALCSVTLQLASQWHELHDIFTAHAASIFQEIHGKAHPLTMTWKKLTLLPTSERSIVVAKILRCALDYCTSLFGLLDRRTLQLHFGYLGALDKDRKLGESELGRVVNLLTHTCKRKDDLLSEGMRMDIISQLAYEHTRDGNVAEAEQLLGQLKPWLEDDSNQKAISWPVVRYYYFKNMARVCSASERMNGVEEYYIKLYFHSISRYGPIHDRTLDAVQLLASHHEGVGKLEEADRWHQLYKEGCAMLT
jgi:hypothetical protein